MPVHTKSAKLHEKLENLKRALGEIGPIAQGSILRRTIRREPRVHAGQTKVYGPYYQWTRKIAGRTTIQNLTAPQAAVWKRAIRENRRLEQIVSEMRVVSLKLLEWPTPSVAKRERKRKHL